MLFSNKSQLAIVGSKYELILKSIGTYFLNLGTKYYKGWATNDSLQETLFALHNNLLFWRLNLLHIKNVTHVDGFPKIKEYKRVLCFNNTNLKTMPFGRMQLASHRIMYLKHVVVLRTYTKRPLVKLIQ